VNQTGVRKLREVDDLAGLSRAEQVELLRSRMDALGGAVEQPVVDGSEVIATPSDLARVLPGGGLARRVVTQVADCPALVIELIAQATAGGGHVGIVGWPELSLAGVVDNGNLNNVIAVPDPGVDPLGIIGVLVEGLDLVVARWQAPLELSPVRARPLLGKLRGGSAALVMVGVPGRVVAVDAVTVVTGRRTADVSLKRAGPLTAVDQVLASVGGDVPIVAAVSGGIRPPADRRVVGVVPTSGGSAPIEGLCRARAAGYTEVALVTADEHGHAAVVVCDLGRRPDSQRQ